MSLEHRAKFCLACDCVIFSYANRTLNVALIARNKPPFVGQWALPGGFVEAHETIDEGAQRELEEETGISHTVLESFGTYSKVDRDPRGRVISIGFMALVDPNAHRLMASGDAAKVAWVNIKELPTLAFDHSEILADALRHLQEGIQIRPIGLCLLPSEFTLSSLQELYETILDVAMDKRNFRKKVSRMPFVVSTGKKQTGQANRPAELYRFVKS